MRHARALGLRMQKTGPARRDILRSQIEWGFDPVRRAQIVEILERHVEQVSGAARRHAPLLIARAITSTNGRENKGGERFASAGRTSVVAQRGIRHLSLPRRDRAGQPQPAATSARSPSPRVRLPLH